jgi:carboxylesterase type B
MFSSLIFIYVLSLIFRAARGAPLDEANSEDSGIRFHQKRGTTTLTLPYGTWKAQSYDLINDIYFFQDVRFAAPPTGNLRFAKPAPPQTVSGVQSGTGGKVCHGTIPPRGLNFVGDGDFSPISQYVNELIGGVASDVYSTGTEDCLFLDLYVPGKAIRSPSTSKLPVINWIFGGAYLLGSKDSYGVYNPTGIIKASGNNVIFVAGNYRLGAFGWLAGTNVEKQATSNVGLYDQRAVLQWIQSYIYLVGGDKTKVTAMGESAGASSLMHHLTAFGGTQDPLFSQAILQSPAYEPIWDRNGSMNQMYASFLNYSGCAGKAVDCLRSASETSLVNANKQLQALGPSGSFAVGPSIDGSWVNRLPAIELQSGIASFHLIIPSQLIQLGNFWKGIQSLVLSHTSQESIIFVDGHVQTNQDFVNFLTDIFPASSAKVGLVTNLTALYPAVGLRKSSSF